jgi:tetratricopeptide (TPR) repeat protein
VLIANTGLFAQKTSSSEDIFRQFLDKEDKTVAKIIINSNDSLYSYFCQGFLSDKQREKRRLFTQFILLEPKLGAPRAFYYIGLSYAQSNKPDSALYYYNISILQDSSYINAYYSRGELYQMMNKHQLAIEDFNRVIKKNPNIASAYHLRGLSYVSLKNFSWALADFNKTIELDPSSDQTYMMRGIIYRESEDYLIAIENWKTAKKLNKDNEKIADQLIEDCKQRIKKSKE